MPTTARRAGSETGGEVSNISVNDASSSSAQVRRREPQLDGLVSAAAPGRSKQFKVADRRAPDPNRTTVSPLPSAVAILSRRHAAAGLIHGAARKGKAVSSPHKFWKGKIFVEMRSVNEDSPRLVGARCAQRRAFKLYADAG